jgi:membrane protein YqaA with SNARE-associated domain
MSSSLFWLVATVQIALSIGLVLRLRRTPKGEVSDRQQELATGQRKDSWLACAVVWAVILSNGSSVYDPLCVAGAFVLAWLLGRTLRRLIVSFAASRRQRDG